MRHAVHGVGLMLRTQHNARVHSVATGAVVVAGLALGISATEWAVIILACVAVWVSEALNTAFEFLCDVASPEFHPLVQQAKDVAAAAVLFSAIGAVVIGLVVFAPRLLVCIDQG